MKIILFILGCSLIALGMTDYSIESVSNSNVAKSAVPQVIYWALLPLENNIGKYTTPIIGLIMVFASAFMKTKNKHKKKKPPNHPE
ncbi:hypothetical protein QRO11_05770 [Paracidovorax citrulli]|uniref:hypothetical protein n=1 Tax=Paracidovorax citrulli TaxID=80869 RepID=UPI00088200AD|nr:hypothetical protein [Paracidovorax citrulli]UMT89396.1 hypothetical protein FRC90_15875 [Paracidovorax citrulli]WIY35845.1 hypothetical protein QRO11_05770 [Paracidovorax citrulli]SDL04095.1 hypothetical protein SAMN04489709_1304 [Paracidovorax citrulli]